ncbi:MAG: type I-E CRISPR-associated protein Cse1/CasA [Lachnospiraceae bacterium]|nr:type I-E CRISPR-associated protein Cse1/CasA [Lachnospiraceae bacterium]
MQEKEFNLLEEPWIKVIMPSLEQKEVSLTDAIIYAHQYKNLSGEMATQDAAMFRLLLAITVTIFYRYDADGTSRDLREEDEWEEEESDDELDENTVLRRWKRYWKKGRFSEHAVREYLETWRERFWLFHPETPFWQVKDLPYGTDYGVECLLGNMKESNNKKTQHHFSMMEGEELARLSYGEVTRWLIHLNAYAVNVKTDKKDPAPGLPTGVGRLGQLGLIMVNGENLFEILMLNLCAQNTDKELWEEPKPIWEQKIRMEQGCDREEFDNLPELYTMQSRRIMLKRNEDGHLIGFRAMGGDFLPFRDKSNEPMTIWKWKKEDKKAEPQFSPQIHNPAVHAWREFPTLIDATDSDEKKTKKRIPGVVQWIQALQKTSLISTDCLITFRMIGMVYGDQMSYTYGECIEDTLTMSINLLMDLNKVWRSRITEQVEKCQSVASEAMDRAAYQLCKLLYGNIAAKGSIKDVMVSQYYFSINGPFREWLVGIKPESDNEEKLEEWERQSYQYARKTIEDYITDLGVDPYIYREEETKDGRKSLLTIPQIMNRYLWKLRQIYKIIVDERGEGNENESGN